MRVRMTTHITGARNGVEWPPVGGYIELPDHEAADLIGAGYATAAPAAEDSDPAQEVTADETTDEPETGSTDAEDSDSSAAEDSDPAPAKRPQRERKAPARRRSR